MKHAVNFRLSHNTIGTLSVLEKELHSSKTAIVEKAVQFYAKKKLLDKNFFMEYAGFLSEEEGDSMLAIIQSSRRSKKIKVKL